MYLYLYLVKTNKYNICVHPVKRYRARKIRTNWRNNVFTHRDNDLKVVQHLNLNFTVDFNKNRSNSLYKKLKISAKCHLSRWKKIKIINYAERFRLTIPFQNDFILKRPDYDRKAK